MSNLESPWFPVFDHMTCLKMATEMNVLRVLVLTTLFVSLTSGLDNGLALTPPMGWLSWERFLCNINCTEYPDSCISEKLYKTMADLLVSEGYSKLGYEYVNIDDCWIADERDPVTGALRPNAERFPNGIKALADYIHSKGLKMGIYADFGLKTCVGYPGSEFHLQQDAETFASWGVDMLKMDGCNSDVKDMPDGYKAMGLFLNKTGRPFLYSCSWPAYVGVDYKAVAKTCNIWRNYKDMGDSWSSIRDIIDFYSKDQGNFSQVAGPGHFNDPDMIIVGDFGLSYDQQRVQMALWSIMASPLFMSNDLRNIPPESKALLQNERVLQINQDPLGIQGKRVSSVDHIDIWTRQVSPKGESIAFAVLNLNEIGYPKKITVAMKGLGCTNLGGYMVSDVFTGDKVGVFKPNDSFIVKVNPTGVFFGLAQPVHLR